MHSAYCVHVHMYMHYTHPLRTCRYAAILANRPSSIYQAAAIAANHTQWVNSGNGDCSPKHSPVHLIVNVTHLKKLLSPVKHTLCMLMYCNNFGILLTSTFKKIKALHKEFVKQKERRIPKQNLGGK